ncbi:MAG: WD40-repeat-containing domain protein [Podila humilis]|nr:MAG: WD40-repeat-containing domain protein [Podila humilis]
MCGQLKNAHYFYENRAPRYKVPFGCLPFSLCPPSGQQIASGGEDRMIRLWDAQTGACCQMLSGHKDRVMSVAYSSSGNQLASVSEDRTIRLWDVISGHCFATMDDVESTISSVVWSENSDGSFL